MPTVAENEKPAYLKDWGPGPFVKIITSKQVAVSAFVRFRNANVSGTQDLGKHRIYENDPA